MRKPRRVLATEREAYRGRYLHHDDQPEVCFTLFNVDRPLERGTSTLVYFSKKSEDCRLLWFKLAVRPRLAGHIQANEDECEN